MDGQVTAFFEERIIARGPKEVVTRAVEEGWLDRLSEVRVFEDVSGRVVDLDIWDAQRATARAAFSPGARREAAAPAGAAGAAGGRGRPRLGVTAREVTLLPRHWEWLAQQPGGASAALRRLVEAARKEAAAGRTPEAARDAVYRFLTDVGGDRPGYEEAMRALYRGENERLREITAAWPHDVRRYAEELMGEGTSAS